MSASACGLASRGSPHDRRIRGRGAGRGARRPPATSTARPCAPRLSSSPSQTRRFESIESILHALPKGGAAVDALIRARLRRRSGSRAAGARSKLSELLRRMQKRRNNDLQNSAAEARAGRIRQEKRMESYRSVRVTGTDGLCRYRAAIRLIVLWAGQAGGRLRSPRKIDPRTRDEEFVRALIPSSRERGVSRRNPSRRDCRISPMIS